MKECPSCGSEVPSSAGRCKECFHDFSEKKSVNWAGPLLLLGVFASMAVIGAVTFFIVLQQPLESHVQVDEETESVIYITQYRSGPVTKRLMWSEVARLEHVVQANGKNTINAYTISGEQWVIHEATEKPLQSQARHYESLMGKPLVMIDNTRGFHKTAQQEPPPAPPAPPQ